MGNRPTEKCNHVTPPPDNIPADNAVQSSPKSKHAPSATKTPPKPRRTSPRYSKSTSPCRPTRPRRTAGRTTISSSSGKKITTRTLSSVSRFPRPRTCADVSPASRRRCLRYASKATTQASGRRSSRRCSWTGTSYRTRRSENLRPTWWQRHRACAGSTRSHGSESTSSGCRSWWRADGCCCARAKRTCRCGSSSA